MKLLYPTRRECK